MPVLLLADVDRQRARSWPDIMAISLAAGGEIMQRNACSEVGS